MEIEFTQEDYELSKVIFRNMLEMFRSKHKGNTAIDEHILRNFAGFYSWCIVTKRIKLKKGINIPNSKIIMILENGLSLYFGSDIKNVSNYLQSFPHTPSSELGILTSVREIIIPTPPTIEVKCSSKINKIIESYKKEYGIK